jgi:hypothetical protein
LSFGQENAILTVHTTSAIVWGSSAKHSRGQKVGLDHVLEDEGEYMLGVPGLDGTNIFVDVVTIVKK